MPTIFISRKNSHKFSAVIWVQALTRFYVDLFHETKGLFLIISPQGNQILESRNKKNIRWSLENYTDLFGKN